MSDDNVDNASIGSAANAAGSLHDANTPERSTDWKPGLAIASGVPLLILPSLGYFPM